MENELIGDFQSQKQGLQSIRRKNRNQCAGKKRFGNKHDLTPMTVGTTVKGLHRRNSQNAYHHYGNTVIMKDPAVCYPSENGGFSRAASIQTTSYQKLIWLSKDIYLQEFLTDLTDNWTAKI